MGTVQSIEGLFDAGIAAIGSIGSLFGGSTKWAEDIIKYEATNEWIGKPLDSVTQIG